MTSRKQPPVLRPLLGFGPWGIALLTVAAALAYSVFTGYDLRHKLLELINWAFGWQALNWFVYSYIPAQLFSLTDPQFGPLGLTYLLLAMYLSPERQAWWRWCLAAAWALACPHLWWNILMLYSQHIGPFAAPWFSAITGGEPLFESMIIVAVPSSAMLLWLTRSWIVPATHMATTLFWVWNSTQVSKMASSLPLDSIQLAILFHLINTAAMLTIAVRRRLRVMPPGTCKSCGYDPTGLAPGAPCPECGRT